MCHPWPGYNICEAFSSLRRIYKVSIELGELRTVSERGPASIAIGQEIVQTELKKLEFSSTVEDAVRRAYDKLDSYHMDQS